MSIVDDKSIEVEEVDNKSQQSQHIQIETQSQTLNLVTAQTLNFRSSDLLSQENNYIESNQSSLSDTLQLIPSLNYFLNKNNPASSGEEEQSTDTNSKIESYLTNFEKFTKKNNKKFRIMDQQEKQQEQEPSQLEYADQSEQAKQEETQTEEGTGLKKTKSMLRKSNRGNLIRQLTHESEKAASAHVSDGEESEDETGAQTKKNTLANSRLNQRFTHLFFFKSDCTLSSLSKQIVKGFNNFEFMDEAVNTNMTTDDSDHRSRSVDRSDVSQSEPDDDETHKSRSSADEDASEPNDGTNRSSRSRKRSRNRYTKSTRIIRIDLSEVDVVFDDPKTTATKIEYLDDLFKENSINKFYAFKRTTNLSSLYLATNIAVSMSSVDSDSDSEESKDIASLHISGEKVSDIRRNSTAQQNNSNNKSILNNKNFVKLVTNKEVDESEDKKSIKKKIAAIKQATFDKIRSRSGSKKRRNKSENEQKDVDDPKLHYIDLRDYDDEKKKDLNDPKLDLFLESRIVSTRRNAITARIDRYYRGAELITYMENLLRQEYIENFLL